LALSLTLGIRRSEAAAPELSNADLDGIIAVAVSAANATNSAFRVSPTAQPTKMQIAIVARDGKLLRLFSMADAWVGSIDIAIAKARTAAFFSSDQNALTSRIVGDASQPGGPLWGIGNSNQIGISGSQEFRNGIITFPGGIPLYKNGVLVGGIGVSGDGVDQDEQVALAGAAGFPPGQGVSKLGF
ncbi:MAG TPA: heme-binding protein, partial [Gemmatimonadaceae bacterium]|nr:heme-binding protein [Gemmatimonadaceae bacterium]